MHKDLFRKIVLIDEPDAGGENTAEQDIEKKEDVNIKDFFGDKKPTLDNTEDIPEISTEIETAVKSHIEKNKETIGKDYEDLTPKEVIDIHKQISEAQVTPGEYKYLPAWDVLLNNLSTEETPWELPELLKTGKKEDGTLLTQEEEAKLLFDTIVDNHDFAGDDPFLQEYLEAKEKGMDGNAFLQSKIAVSDISKMNNEDKVKAMYKEYASANKLEWTEDDIDEKVDAMSKVDLDIAAKNYENSLVEIQRRKNSEQVEKINKEFDSLYLNIEKQNANQINTFLNSIEGKKSIAGIEFGEAEMTQFKQDVASFIKREIKIDRDSGLKYAVNPMEELLRNILAKPEDTLKLLPYLWMIKTNKLEGYSTRLKERYKEIVDDTLDNNPDVSFGTSKSERNFNPKAFFGKK